MSFKKLIFAVLILFSGVVKSQDFPLEVSEINAPNSIVNYKGQKLILVDFWATWCAPCRPAAIQLEFLQEQFKDELFIVSVTDEGHEAVERYIKKRSAKLLVARDIAGNLIRKFNIYARPYAILFNADGKLLWQGHPSDLKDYQIREFHRKNRNIQGKSSVDEFMTVLTPAPEDLEEERVVKGLFAKKIKDESSEFIKKKNYVDFYGTISELVGQIKRVPTHFIKCREKDNFYLHLQSPTKIWERKPDSVLSFVEQKFKLSILSKEMEEKVYLVDVAKRRRLWAADQIDWGEEVLNSYLLGEERIQADNYSIADFFLLLGNIKGKTFLYKGNNKKLYDWDLHFYFDDLMKMELFDEFGIKIEKGNGTVTYFRIKKNSIFNK